MALQGMWHLGKPRYANSVISLLYVCCCAVVCCAAAAGANHTVTLTCPPNTTWRCNTLYVLQNCWTTLLPPVFHVGLTPDATTTDASLYGNISVRVEGGNIVPRITLNTTLNKFGVPIVVGNISVVLLGVMFQLNASAPNSHEAVLGAAGAECTLGGVLMCIVAESWHNISLEITHSSIMVIGPGWLFNWTSSIGTSNRISGLVTLSSNTTRNNVSACEGFSVNVTNSTINITEVVGVSVMFVVQHFAASPLRNIHAHFNSGSIVALSSHRDESMCNQLKKYHIQLAVQTILLIEGSMSSNLSSVSCCVDSARVVVRYIANMNVSACRQSGSVESGVAIIRSFHAADGVVFRLRRAASVHIRMMLAPLMFNETSSYASQSTVFGVSKVDSAYNFTGVAEGAVDGPRPNASVDGSDFASVFMLHSIKVVGASSINVTNVDATIATTATSKTTARGSSVVLLELVDLVHHTRVVLTALHSSVGVLPGNDTNLLAASASLFFLKGGLGQSSINISSCVLHGSAANGIFDGSFLMTSVAAVLFFASDPSYSVTHSMIEVTNVKVLAFIKLSSAIHVSSSNLFQLSTASIGLICAPLPVASSYFSIDNCSAESSSIVIGSVLKKSFLSAVVSSAPLPPQGLVASFSIPIDVTIINSIRNSLYYNVTVVVQHTSLVSPSLRTAEIEAGGFEGSTIVILPLVLSGMSNITIRHCRSQQDTNESSASVTSVTYFSSSMIASVTDSTINGSSFVQLSDCDAFAHMMVSILGNLSIGSNALISIKRVTVRAQNASSTASGMKGSPIVAQGSQIVAFPLPASIVFEARTSLTIDNTSMIGFNTFVSATTVTFSRRDTCQVEFSCVHWKGAATHMSSSLLESPLSPVLHGVPLNSIAFNNTHCEGELTHTMSRTAYLPDGGSRVAPYIAPRAQPPVTAVSGASGIAASVSVAVSAAFGGGVVAANFQVFALLGLSPCAPSNLQSSSSISKYIVVSPFYDLGDEAQIIGNIGLVVLLVAIQLVARRATQTGPAVEEHPNPEVRPPIPDPQHIPPTHTLVSFVNHLRRFPRYSVMLGTVLIPGVWRSALVIIFSRGDGGRDAVSTGNVAASLTIGVVGGVFVAAAAVWWWRESKVLDRRNAARRHDSDGTLAYHKYHVSVVRKHSLGPNAPLWVYPSGFWGPDARRLTHGPLRNLIKGGSDAGKSVRYMTAYPTVVTLLVAVAISVPHIDNASRVSCIVSWVLLCMIYSGSGVVVMLVRPGRSPLSDVLFAALMASTTLVTIIAAAQSATSAEDAVGALNTLFLVVSLIGTALSIAKTAHQCATYVWEQRVLQTTQKPTATPPRSPVLKPPAEHQAMAQSRALSVQPPTQAVVSRTTPTVRNYLRTTQAAQLESLLTLICGRTRNH
jgi:hypothetical protein